MQVRHKFIERVGAEKGRFECPEGHRFVDFMIGEKQRKFMKGNETGLKMYASWWSKNGVTMECPHCMQAMGKRK